MTFSLPFPKRMSGNAVAAFFRKKRLVLRAQNGADCHQDKGDIVSKMREFAEDDEREERSDEGRDGVIGTRPRGTQKALRIDVEEDAQAVGDEPDAEHGKDAPKHRDALSDDKTDDERACSRKDALQKNDLQGIFGGDLPRTVVFKSPTDAGEQDQERSEGEFQARDILKGEERAGERDKDDPCPEPGRNALLEYRKRDDGRCHDLEIVQKRCVGGRRALEPQHQADGRGDIEGDHGERIGKLLFREAGLSASAL